MVLDSRIILDNLQLSHRHVYLMCMDLAAAKDDNIFLMCQSGECESCRLAAKEAQSHVTYVRDEKIDRRITIEKPIKWRKFASDVKVGNGADEADPIDTSFLTIKPK